MAEPNAELVRILPCLRCQHPSAQAARDEIGWTFLAARHGSTLLKTSDGDVRPSRCCRRRSGKVDVSALVA